MRIAPEPPAEIFGMTFNMVTLYMSWIVMGVLVLVFYLTTRKMSVVPGRWQLLVEMFVDAFDSLARQTLAHRGRKYLPFIGSIFLFVWGCNMIGIIPGFEEPTRDLNTPIALAILAIGTAQVSAIVVRGFRSWWWEFFEPAFPGEGLTGKILGGAFSALFILVYGLALKGHLGAREGMSAAGRLGGSVAFVIAAVLALLTAIFAIQMRKVPNIFMAPLNVVGEIGKSISLPFRLYGNIFGGAVIIIVLAGLLCQIILPVGLMLFFGLFVGTIQAFVFTMLSMTYIAVAIAEQKE